MTVAPTDDPTPGQQPDLAGRCPVTVVGERRRVDLALPLSTVVGEYIGLVVDLCGQPTTESLPEVWSLAPLGRAPLPLDARLADHDPVEGMVLYLRDLAADEAFEPEVTDLDDLVAESTDALGRWRWHQPAVAVTLLAIGAAWLVATVLLVTLGPHRPAGADAFAAAVGLVLPAVAAVAWRRRLPLPEPLLIGFALAAPACLACAGWLALHRPAGALLAGCVGGVIAFVAMPAAATGAVALWVAVIAACGAPLAALAVTGARVFSVAALAGFALLAAGPAITGRLALYRPALYRPALYRPAQPDDTAVMTDAVRRAYRMLGVWTVAAGLAMGVALVGLARSADRAAWALVGTLAVALILRAVCYRFVIEAVAAIAAAGAGLVALTVTVGGAGTVAVASGVGVLLLTIGGWLRSRSPFADRRPHWLMAASTFFATLALLAALTVWGAMHWMLAIGRSLA